jgi:hypothetical protein
LPLVCWGTGIGCSPPSELTALMNASSVADAKAIDVLDIAAIALNVR